MKIQWRMFIILARKYALNKSFADFLPHDHAKNKQISRCISFGENRDQHTQYKPTFGQTINVHYLVAMCTLTVKLLNIRAANF